MKLFTQDFHFTFHLQLIFIQTIPFLKPLDGIAETIVSMRPFCDCDSSSDSDCDSDCDSSSNIDGDIDSNCDS